MCYDQDVLDDECVNVVVVSVEVILGRAIRSIESEVLCTANGLHRMKNLYLSPKTPNTHRTNTVQALHKHRTVRCCFGLK